MTTDQQPAERDVLMGFDPSWSTMGAARYVPASGDLLLYSGDFDDVLRWTNQFDLNRVVAVVENPALDSVSFNAWQKCRGVLMAWIRGKASLEEVAMIVKGQFKSSRNVGENQAAGKYFIKRLREAGVPVLEIAPSTRVVAFKEVSIGKTTTKQRRNLSRIKYPTKSTAGQFEEWCGYPRRKGNNEHSRDAATLIVFREILDVVADIVKMKADRKAAEERKRKEREFKKRIKNKTK